MECYQNNVMKPYIPVKLDKTWADAYVRYKWESGVEGFCVRKTIVHIAEMANKPLLFLVKRRRRGYMISPKQALEIANKYNAYYTISNLGRNELVVVIPRTACRSVAL